MTENQPQKRWTTASIWVASCLLLSLTLLLRPYNGIRHDSILYFGQALRILSPENLNHDLFFAYGSQAEFTVFPQILAQLIVWLGIEHASIMGLLLGFALFLSSSAFFAYKALPKHLGFWGLLFLLAWPSGYGGSGIFSFQEPFFTGRTFAEPLVIGAMACTLMEKRWLALGILILAASQHPLQALPGFFVWWGWQLQTNRRWLLLGIVALVMAVITAPMTGLFNRYDPAWFESIKEPNRHVFMLGWPLSSWIWLALDFFILALALPYMAAPLRRWAQIVLASTALCCAASMALVDLLHVVLFAGLQLWRAQWLLHWTALLCAPLIVYSLWQERQKTRLILFSTTLLAAAPAGPMAAVYAGAFTVPLYLAWPKIQQHVSAAYVKALYFGLALALGVTYLRYLGHLLKFSMNLSTIQWGGLWLSASHPIIIMAATIAGFVAWKKHSTARPIIVLLSATLFIAATLYWDQRSESSRFIEEKANSPAAFGYPLEDGASVLWDEDLAASWILLRRASYWSNQQQAGLLFNRGTALEAHRREELLMPLLFQEEICRLMDGLNKQSGSCQIDISALHDPCHDTKNHSDYFVISSLLPIKPLGSLIFNASSRDGVGKSEKLYLYACKDVP